MLEQFFELPTLVQGPTVTVYDRFIGAGLTVVVNDNGGTRLATPAEIGVSS